MFSILHDVTVPNVVLVLAGAAGTLLGAWLLATISGAMKYIPNDRVGVVEKLWSSAGSIKAGLLALNGEAGFQPDVLRGGFHFFPPFQYRVHLAPMVSVTQGRIGYVFARDGVDLPAGQTLASNARVEDFRDVRGFLAGGGQKGPQRKVLREGTRAWTRRGPSTRTASWWRPAAAACGATR